MRSLADMGLSLDVAEWLRGRGHDIIHVRDERMHRAPDEEIFLKAAREGRIVVTFDLDFGEILALSGDRTRSVLLFRLHNTRTTHVVDRLTAVLPSTGRDLLAGAIVVIEEGRHRVRRLPIA